MKLVSSSRSRDGIGSVNSWTEITHGAIHTKVSVGSGKSITSHYCPIVKVSTSSSDIGIYLSDDREGRYNKPPKASRGRTRSPGFKCRRSIGCIVEFSNLGSYS